MINVLVTGGAGYIGSHVVKRLIKKKYKVTVVDNLSTGSKYLIPNKKVSFSKIDICDFDTLYKLFKKKKFQFIFHFAAALSVSESQFNPKKYYVNNVYGTENILNLCKIFNIKNIIFSSTCAVYGSVSGSIKESRMKNPQSHYGKTKDICEDLIIKYSKISNLNYSILRYFNVIGADAKNQLGQISSDGLFKKLSKNIVKKKYNISIYGNDYKTRDGTCIRDYIDVNDLADIHILSMSALLKKKKNIIINCGYNKGFSVKEIVSAFSKVIQRNINIKYLPRRAGDVESIWSNNTKLIKTFPNWKQKYKLFDSIKNTLRWEKKNNG